MNNYAKPYRPKTCTVEGCTAKHYALTWCKNHYARNLRYGRPDHPVHIRPTRLKSVVPLEPAKDKAA